MCPALALLLIAIPVPLQEKSGRPRHPWAEWKTGVQVEYRVTQQNGNGPKSDQTVTFTLLKVGRTECTIGMKFDSKEETSVSEQIQSLLEKAGEETITAAGKQWDCVIWKSKVEWQNRKTERLEWIPKGSDVPVKIVADDFEGVAVEIDQTVEAAGKKYRCVRLEGTLGKSYPGNAILWLTHEIPGRLLRKKINTSGRCESITVDWELLKVEAKK